MLTTLAITAVCLATFGPIKLNDACGTAVYIFCMTSSPFRLLGARDKAIEVKKITVTFAIHHTVLYCRGKMLLYEVCFARKKQEHNDWMRIKTKVLPERDGRVYGNYCDILRREESQRPSL